MIAKGTLVYTDEHDIYSRLIEWGYEHETVCHGAGEFARDDDGDGFCEVHVNTLEGFWSLLRSWLRPHRGIPQESLPLYLGFFEFVHNVRARGKEALGVADWPLTLTTLQSIMSQPELMEIHGGSLAEGPFSRPYRGPSPGGLGRGR